MGRRFEINDPKLERARKALAAWRMQRRRLGPMPEPLWRSAVALARRYGASRISSELRVNYERLRARLPAEAPPLVSCRETPPPAPTFVELATIPGAMLPECTIEIERVGGGRLTMRLPGQRGADLVAALGYAFVGRAQA
jgi:hypothetical protein